eukprot:TRINITY_DN4029_c0_g1_i1.p1 TRINITY_DN4029_c0_g1~~TRINITY_DN4029_c0_g1_i1.p1  ORF type:complete len:159 (-),score=13.28 TRINITY_DN4029_c0_g1_i1:128-604(-)
MAEDGFEEQAYRSVAHGLYEQDETETRQTHHKGWHEDPQSNRQGGLQKEWSSTSYDGGLSRPVFGLSKDIQLELGSGKSLPSLDCLPSFVVQDSPRCLCCRDVWEFPVPFFSCRLVKKRGGMAICQPFGEKVFSPPFVLNIYFLCLFGVVAAPCAFLF